MESSRGHHLPAGWTEKSCPGCGVVKPREAFGSQSRCRDCRSRHYRQNKDKIKESRKRRYHADREGAMKRTRDWKRANPSKTRDYILKSKYGVPYGTFDRLLKEQEGRCAICRKAPSKTLHLDHCHGTNAIRALLCDNCNRGLGHFQEDADTLRRAADYLESFS
jgi:hypothetical protein